MISSNSSIDFIELSKLGDVNVQELITCEGFSDWFKEYLNEHVVTLQFTKKDGTQRLMTCTRNLENIPNDKHPKGNERQIRSGTIQVFDTDIGDWRSFNIGSLTRINWQ